MNKNILFTIFAFVFSLEVSAQLFINEVNQGPGGNPPNEYVELVVVGTKTCIDSCANLQNWILDDNNGFFGTSGIAAGHIRFNSNSQWACVPFGTIIVIYNSLNPYTGIVADETDANNDNVYFLPSNSSYFEGNLTTPMGGIPSTTYAGSTYSANGAVWDVLGMQNGNDVFQTVAPSNLTAGFHSVGWGSSAGMDIAFLGSAAGLLFQNENITNNDPTVQTNWASKVENLGTPGLPNSVNNLAWITAMNAAAPSATFDTIFELICSTDSFLFNGNYYKNLGSYTDTLPSTNCDSIVTLNLSLEVCSSCNMDLGPDTLICGPVNYTLDAGIFDEYLWQNGSTNQTFTATSTGTYYCQGYNFDTTNLVVNPGFESGNVNFTTNYVVGAGGSWGQLSNAGTYAITTSPNLVHNNFPPCSDHTPGVGNNNMMVVNGSNTANQAVWCQTINVNQNTDYYFSIWATSVENTNAANVSSLFFKLNGVQIGTNFSPPYTTCTWQEYTQTWNSGTNTTVNLCIFNHTISGNNDFAIDDIFFGETCVASDTIQISNIPSAIVSDSITVCFKDSAMIFGQMQNTAGVYNDTLLSVLGCDSLYSQTTLFIGDSLYSNQNAFICFSDSIFLENAWQNTTNIYVDTVQNANGCDSLIYTNLVVFAPPTSDTVVVCSNNLLDVGVSIIDTIPNYFSCDSIYIYESTVFSPTTTDTVFVCTNNPLDVGTVIIDTISNALSCDSVYNYETTFLASLDSSFSLSCTNNSALAESRIDTFSNALGCDSFYAHIDVTYLVPFDTIVVDTCTNIQVNAQNYIDTVFTYNGCDSIYRRTIVNYISRDTTFLPSLCTNDLALATINYTDFTSYQGCDSATNAQEVVYIMPDTTFLPDLEICFGNVVNIFGVSRNQSGLYENEILSVGGCDSIMEYQSLVVHPNPTVYAGADTTIEENENVLLQATGANTYTWNTGDLGTNLNVSPSETTTYSVLGIDTNSCQDLDSVTVFVIIKEIKLFVPTGFSPNGDGVNDFFKILNEGDFEKISLKIYNRWGELIYVNTKNAAAWDGTYKNVNQDIGTYIYYIEATAKKNQQKFDVSGSVSLIR